nr:cytidylate kinase family protein [Clostridia bacterium]
MRNKISLAGDLGSGKSTVARILIEALGAEYYCTGSIVRSIAEKMGMTTLELNEYMETHPEIDKEIDDGIRALSEDERALVIDSRMAWHFTKGTFKVYLSTDIETSALRIMNANRKGEHAATLEETVAETRARRQSERKRYMDMYGVDIKSLFNYSLVVDTTVAAPDRIASLILSEFERFRADPTAFEGAPVCYLSPERINYPEDEDESSRLDEYLALLEVGDKLPEAKVMESEGEFYIREGRDAALAYALCMYDFVPARLVSGEPDGKYVKMTNSL